MNISKLFYLVLIVISTLLPGFAHANQILDKINIEQKATEVDVHIDFFTQVRYLRHTPTKESSSIQVFLEFPQLKTIPNQRETLVSPPSDLVPAFKVFFADQKVSNRLAIRFDKPVKFRVSSDNSGRGIVIHLPLPKVVKSIEPEVIPPEPEVIPKSAPIEIPGIPAGMSLDEYAKKMVAESRVASGLGDHSKAIQLLNAVLNLPQHAYSQEAQELIGVAREKNGELAKAKAEYGLYLKLYPEGEGAKRITKRLAEVDLTSKAAGAAQSKKPVREIHETTVSGMWDQYYYDAHSDSYNPDKTRTSTHDQSTLMSSISLIGRSRQNQYDSKIVFRNRQTMDFIAAHDNKNSDRTDAAYVEVANSEVDYLVRLGRQSGNTGGVLGRFDGGLFRYGISPKFKVNFVAGDLVEYKVDYKRSFYGLNVDIGPIAEHWSGNAYFIAQEVGPRSNSILDRRAVGGDLRFSKGGLSIFSNVDYDTLFDRLNTIMVQGNWQQNEATNYNVLFDQRKSPILTMVSGLSSAGTFCPGGVTPSSVNQALLCPGVTKSVIADNALRDTLDTDLYLIGMTRQITPRWQLGADVQMSRTSGTGNVAATAEQLFIDRVTRETGIPPTVAELNDFRRTNGGSGNIWTYHAQVVGLDTLFQGDTSIVSGSYTTGETNKISSIILTNMMVPAEKWRLDSTLKLMRIDSWQAGIPNTVTNVISPTVRANYRLRDNTSLEAEVGLEVTNVNDPTNGHSRIFRDFSFIGYRIDI